MTRDTQATAVSLNIRGHLPTGKRPRYLHFKENVTYDHYSVIIWAMYLKLSDVLCLQKVRQKSGRSGIQKVLAEASGPSLISNGSWGKVTPLHWGDDNVYTQQETLTKNNLCPSVPRKNEEQGKRQKRDLSLGKPINNT